MATVDWTDPVTGHPLNDGLAAWWLSGEGAPYWGTSTFRDLMRTYPGTFAGSPTPLWRGPSGREGWGAVSFDGATAGQAVTTTFQFGTVSTVSFWFYPRTVPGAGTYVAPLIEANVSSVFHGFLMENGLLQVWNNIDSSGTLTAAVTAKKWVYVSLVRDGNSVTGGLKLYMNGVLAASGNTGAWTPPATALWLGNQQTVTTRILDGLLDDIRLYNTALTTSQVAALYAQAAARNPDTLRWIPESVYWVSVAGGTTHTRSLSDTLATQDLFARLANAARSLTDTLGLSDAYARTTTALRSLSDTLAASDTFARVATANRAFTDTAAMADTYARTANGLRSLSDTLAATDAFARVADANRTLPDTLALADAYSRVSAANRALTDTAGASDAFARVADAYRLFTDTLALTDLATLVGVTPGVTPGALSLAVVDALGFADAFSRTADANRALTDTLGLAEAFLRVASANRALADTLGAAEAFARQADALRALTDTLGLAEIIDLEAAAAMVVSGPFFIDAVMGFSAGAVAAEGFAAGAAAAQGAQ